MAAPHPAPDLRGNRTRRQVPSAWHRESAFDAANRLCGPQLEKLVEKIARIPGIRDLARPATASSFPARPPPCATPGLRRISFSLDSLDPANFKKITGREGLASGP